ncbi:MAG: hypothetical protein WA908_01455 [Pontixanthobacter sp.]
MTHAERAAATERTLERFRGRPLDWRSAHCIKMARMQANALGHNVPPVPILNGPVGARKALAKQGAGSVIELLDKYLTRHPAPAYAIVGDLCALESPDGLDAICIADGMGHLFGWHEATNYEKLETVSMAQGAVKVAWAL